MVYFITGNRSKADVYGSILGRHGATFSVKDLPLVEIQSADGAEIAVAKAKSAYAMLKKPLFVGDSIWKIPALGNFPGPYMKYMNDWLTAADFLRLMRGVKDRRITCTDYFCATSDGRSTELFKVGSKGSILHAPEGRGVPSKTLVSLYPSRRAIAVMTHADRAMTSYARSRGWKELAEWIKKN